MSFFSRIFRTGTENPKVSSTSDQCLLVHLDPLCKNARVIIRLGGPGATQREVRL